MSVETRHQLAVALHYDRTGAPRVIAKGKGAIGAKIIEVARAHDIPIEENEVLAGALSNVELGDEIPAELYKAVAVDRQSDAYHTDRSGAHLGLCIRLRPAQVASGVWVFAALIPRNPSHVGRIVRHAKLEYRRDRI